MNLFWMPVFDTLQDLRNGKKYETIANTRLHEHGSSENLALLSSHWGDADSKSRTRILIQEEVDEQIKNYIAPWLGS